MQYKFWFFYLAFVLLLSGVAYVAISDDTDVPLALSDSEMAVLQATGLDEKCMDWMPGCENTSCDPANFFGTSQQALSIRKCVSNPGHTCYQAGQVGDQESCVITIYLDHCTTKVTTFRAQTDTCR